MRMICFAVLPFDETVSFFRLPFHLKSRPLTSDLINRLFFFVLSGRGGTKSHRGRSGGRQQWQRQRQRGGEVKL